MTPTIASPTSTPDSGPTARGFAPFGRNRTGQERLAVVGSGLVLWAAALLFPALWSVGDESAMAMLIWTTAPLTVVLVGVAVGRPPLLHFGFPLSLGLAWATHPDWAAAVGESPAAFGATVAAGLGYYWCCAHTSTKTPAFIQAGYRERAARAAPELAWVRWSQVALSASLAVAVVGRPLFGALGHPLGTGDWLATLDQQYGPDAELVRNAVIAVGGALWLYCLLALQGPVLRLASAGGARMAAPRGGWSRRRPNRNARSAIRWVSVAAAFGAAAFALRG